MNDELRLKHERIQDLEALVSGRPLPIRGTTSPLRWIVVLLIAAALGVFFPLERVPTASATKWPVRLPPGALTLADDAAPVFTKSNGKDLALVRGWWMGHENLPLHVVALDATDWTVAWTSDQLPATAFDRGAIRVDDTGGVALVFTSLAADDKEYAAISLDRGAMIGSTKTDAKTDEGVRDSVIADEISTSDHHYTLRGNSLKHDDVYDVAVPGIGLESRLGSITVHGQDLVITANDALFIVDPANGHLKKRIDHF